MEFEDIKKKLEKEGMQEITPYDDSGELWDLKTAKENDMIEGMYMGVNETKKGVKIYSFEQEDGSIIKMFGTKIIDDRFDEIISGEKVVIVYKGKRKSQSGGNDYHDFAIFHDKKSVLDKVPLGDLGDESIPIIEDKPIKE